MLNTLRTRSSRAFLRVALLTMVALATPSQASTSAGPADGQHDFDWEFGSWKTELRRLAKPLSGSSEWVEYSGTTVVRKVLDGRENLVELRVKGSAGQIEGMSLRLYNPQTKQWSLNFANVRNGVMTLPVYGSFRNGRGEFYGQDDLDGRAIFVRFVISNVADESWRFEQAYSEDGGRTWETNWIATDTRVKPESSTDRHEFSAGSPCERSDRLPERSPRPNGHASAGAGVARFGLCREAPDVMTRYATGTADKASTGPNG